MRARVHAYVRAIARRNPGIPCKHLQSYYTFYRGIRCKIYFENLCLRMLLLIDRMFTHARRKKKVLLKVSKNLDTDLKIIM